MKQTFLNILIFVCFCSSAQELIPNGSFEDLKPCLGDHSEPTSWIFTDYSRAARVRSSIGQPCTAPSILAAPDGNQFLSFGFSVNTSAVQPLFIQTKLNHPMQKDSVYEISFVVRKDVLSLGSIREIQLVFGTGIIHSHMNIHLRPEQQNVVTIPVMNVSNQMWQQFTVLYRAKGTEQYLAIGSLHQRFQLRQGMMNYAAERQDTPSENAIYFIDKLSIQPTNDNVDWTNERSNNNFINDLPYSTENLIQNGGFENFINEQRTFQPNILPGAEISDGWYNLTNHGTTVIALDNPRLFRNMRFEPYTGKAVAMVDILRTNQYHTYGKSWRSIRHEDEGYSTVHRYENDLPAQPAPYKRGGYLTNVLTRPLIKDSVYLFSSMIRLANTSSFGVKSIGIYFLQDFPENLELQLLQKSPNLIFDLNPENSNSWKEWEELLGFYTAQGGENYVAMGYIDNEENGIFRNTNFVREEFSRCGPRGAHECWDRVITYSDSLFARYMVDNVVLRHYDLTNTLGAQIFPIHQHHHYYLAFDLGGDKANNTKLDALKPILLEAFHGLPYSNSIDFVQLHRSYQRTPMGHEANQNQLRRNIERMRIRRRPGSTKIPERLFLSALDQNHSEQTKQKYILITDGNLHWDHLEHLFAAYSNRLDFLIFFIGTLEKYQEFQMKTKRYSAVESVFFNNEIHRKNVLSKIWR